MQINIQARSFSLTKALRNHVERRLRFAMGTRDEHIHRVIIRLSDINGTRGGQDKCCHIHLVLPQLPDIIIEDTEVDRLAVNANPRLPALLVGFPANTLIFRAGISICIFYPVLDILRMGGRAKIGLSIVQPFVIDVIHE